MSKPKNKAAARDWQAQQQLENDRRVALEAERDKLWYSANKRKTNYPCPNVFDDAGMPEVAAKIREAYAMLEDAYSIFSRLQPE